MELTSNYSIKTLYTSNNAENAEINDYIGKLECEAAGLSVDLKYGQSQKICDDKNAAAIFSPFDETPLNLQTTGYALVADHNYQSFWQLQYIEAGDTVYLDSPTYGQFIYTVDKIEIWNQNQEETDFYKDDIPSLREWCSTVQENGLVLYTCYPFTQSLTNHEENLRFVVFCKLADSTKLAY